MAEKGPQSFEHHARFDPPFHFFLVPVFLLGLIMSLVHFFAHLGENLHNGDTRDVLHSALIVLLALALLTAMFKMRLYALKNQDRIIRLEERLRLMALLQEPLRSRIPELTEDQLIGIRFASDAEVAGIVEKALAQKLRRKQIKQLIKNWRPDYWRV